MRKGRHQPLGPVSTILTVTLLYIILIILVLVLARQILIDISTGKQLGNFYIIPLGIVLPVFLFGTVGIQLIKLIKDRKENRPGTRFKTKLMIFFFAISLLASLPPGSSFPLLHRYSPSFLVFRRFGGGPGRRG